MLKSKEVKMPAEVGSAVSAGNEGVGLMVEPWGGFDGTSMRAMLPVRVRFDHDPARELVISSHGMRLVAGGFSSVELVLDDPNNSGRWFLVTVAETVNDWADGDSTHLSVYRDGSTADGGGVALRTLASILDPSSGAVRPMRGTYGGLPYLATDSIGNPKVLRTDAQGRLEQGYRGETVLLNKTGGWSYTDLGSGTGSVRYLDLSGSSTVTTATEPMSLDVSVYRYIEVSVNLRINAWLNSAAARARFWLTWMVPTSSGAEAPLEQWELGDGTATIDNWERYLLVGPDLTERLTSTMRQVSARPGRVVVSYAFTGGPTSAGVDMMVKLTGRF